MVSYHFQYQQEMCAKKYYSVFLYDAFWDWDTHHDTDVVFLSQFCVTKHWQTTRRGWMGQIQLLIDHHIRPLAFLRSRRWARWRTLAVNCRREDGRFFCRSLKLSFIVGTGRYLPRCGITQLHSAVLHRALARLQPELLYTCTLVLIILRAIQL